MANFAETLQELGVVDVYDKGRVAGGFMHDIRSRCVKNMIDAANIQGDPQHFQCLELHEDCGGDKAIYYYRAPAYFSQAGIHFLDGRNVVQGDAGSLQSLQIHRMG